MGVGGGGSGTPGHFSRTVAEVITVLMIIRGVGGVGDTGPVM